MMLDTNDAIGTRLGQIMDEATRLARTAWMAALAYVVVLTGVGMFVDQMSELNASNIIFSVISFGMGYVLTEQLLRQGGLVPRGLAGTFGGYFGMALMSGLAIALGFVLVIVPGLVLFCAVVAGLWLFAGRRRWCDRGAQQGVGGDGRAFLAAAARLLARNRAQFRRRDHFRVSLQ
jgi:hypothetical protein